MRYKFKMLLLATLLLIVAGVGTTGCGTHNQNTGSWDTTRPVQVYHYTTSSGDLLWYYVLCNNSHYYYYTSPTPITDFTTINSSQWVSSGASLPTEIATSASVGQAEIGKTDLPTDVQAEIQASEPSTTEGVSTDEPSSGSQSDEGSVGGADAGGDSGGSSDGGGSDGGGGGGGE